MNGPTLGVVGGGQLGRMLSEAAAPLGVECVVVDPTPSCPASRVADQIVGSFDDSEAIDALAARADAVTVEIELADPDALEAASEAHDVAVHPAPDTLRTIRDKLVQTETFEAAGVPVPAFEPVTDADDLARAVDRFGRVMCKARTGGYDGRGNVPVGPEDDFAAKLREIGVDPDGADNGNADDTGDASADGGGALAEQFVEFERELSVIGVRGDGERAVYPPTETIHEAEIMRETLVPARCGPGVAERAREVALAVLDALDGRGVFGIELFETTEGEILVNEVAPRPHNSGHWTIEGADCSQFGQHVRAVLGLPLGSPEPRGPTVTANVLGDTPAGDDPTAPPRFPVAGFDAHRQVGSDADRHAGPRGEPRGGEGVELHGVADVLASEAAFHWYGKREVYHLRKTGHLTLARGPDADPESVLARARELRDGLSFERLDADEAARSVEPTGNELSGAESVESTGNEPSDERSGER